MIRLAVIGVGHMGNLHVQKWRQHSEVQLVGVYDSDPERLLSCAVDHGVRAFPTIEEAFAAADAVTIATPSQTHAEIAHRALEAGCHCLVEKPLATRASDAQHLVEIARRNGLVLMSGHIERFNPAFVWLQQQGVQPRFVEAHRLHPFRPRAVDVSVVLDVMIHDIDLLLVLLRSSVQRLEAHGVAVLTSMPDIANVRLVFTNGCVANVTASRISTKFLRKMRLFQPSSYIALDFAHHSVEQVLLRIGCGGLSEGEECLAQWIAEDQVQRCITRRFLELPSADSLWEEQRAFIRAILEAAPPEAEIEQTLEALRVVERAEQELMSYSAA
ncbi:MAG: Gfo/Idh/MocA family oxidoreductase [Candidatus Kapabacteria bacterium]|nr:Gfo/Idh/MocA family oxidoreductase [Candidatus Kapabacteria bacterium]MCS7170027.1 Gfo/Idh/MocA family oxidoreductase [Candidatus Kapabacteria bacterium]MDW7997562.1 Gfo/Idh/MocA family oxidoreductase [Bacteroidota bacterium]MDW8226082.1 Gfo/Idh/MocA family oxidoreductase [Bacteroidota bacterium]